MLVKYMVLNAPYFRVHQLASFSAVGADWLRVLLTAATNADRHLAGLRNTKYLKMRAGA